LLLIQNKTCLISKSESSHGRRTSSGDETDEDPFVDCLDAKADLVVGVLAQNHLETNNWWKNNNVIYCSGFLSVLSLTNQIAVLLWPKTNGTCFLKEFQVWSRIASYEKLMCCQGLNSTDEKHFYEFGFFSFTIGTFLTNQIKSIFWNVYLPSFRQRTRELIDV